VTPDDAWGLTPAEAEVGRKRIAGLRYEGPFTPVSLQETIEAPSNTGGFNWGGLSYDPARDIIVGAVNRFAAIVKLYPRDSAPSSVGGLVFIGATRDNHVRAFDIETGRLLWKALLPAGAQATPMTYESSGTQYVVISAGGHGKLGATLGDYVMAFSLPRGRK